MACGGCAAKRNARVAGMSGNDGKVTKYKVTWGDGSADTYDDYSAARLAMGGEKEDRKRRGMRILSVRV